MKASLNAAHRPPARRQGVRRAVVLMPNGLTLFNLFCGIYAIILAFRGEFAQAPFFIVLGGVADTLDGRVARATNTGSRFGEELDSLVDAISFGFAPALIMYLALPSPGRWEWLLVFFFTACAVMRLARFNVEQAGRSKTHFHGLPSPAAGLTLATYYWFRETPLYNQTVILFTDSRTLADLPWHVLLRGLMAILAALMISDVPYPAVPQIGFKSVRRIIGTIVVAGCFVMLLLGAKEFIFPALLVYVLFGAIKWTIIGFIGMTSAPDEIFWANEAQAQMEGEDFEDRPMTSSRSLTAGGTSAVPESRRERAGADGRQPSASRDGRGSRDGRPTREGRPPRSGRSERSESRERAEPRPPRETREAAEARAPQEPRASRDLREPHGVLESADPLDAVDARMEPEVTGAEDSNELATAAGEPRVEDEARRKRRRRKRGTRPGGAAPGGATPPGPTLPDTPTESTE